MIDDDIRLVLAEHGRLAVDGSAISDDLELYRHGMTSHATVNVMLALEERFDVEFPERLLRRETFATLSAIRCAIVELGVGGAGA